MYIKQNICTYTQYLLMKKYTFERELGEVYGRDQKEEGEEKNDVSIVYSKKKIKQISRNKNTSVTILPAKGIKFIHPPS